MTTPSQSLPCGRRVDVLHAKPDAKTSKDTCARLLQMLADHVAKTGLRQSESRCQMVKVFAGLAGHFSVSDLIALIRKKYPKIGAATVYRNLPTFIEAGVLRETLTLNNGERVFEVETGHHHDHIFCLDCQEIFEFHSEAIEKEQESITKQKHFIPEGHRHVIYARCAYRKKKS